jgi:glucose-6-phosphate dehydrogenase assembly protein OpcA
VRNSLRDHQLTTSDDVWSERNTNPDAIDAALRDLLRKRHAANRAVAPARVLNLIVVVDESRKREVADRLEQLGRHSPSRTILCALAQGRQELDATAVMSQEAPSGAGLGLIHEKVEIDIGPEHLGSLDTIVDPLLISELPTALWCPQHEQAVEALLDVIDAVLLDSDAVGLARAAELARSTHVVDMEWIRTTPWRERLAASFDPPARLAALRSVAQISVCYRMGSLASGLLLIGWLASRMNWKTAPLVSSDGAGLRGVLETNPGEPGIEMAVESADSAGQGVAGVTVTTREGFALSLDKRLGGVRVRERSPGSEEEEVWCALEASSGDSEILGEAVRQALLRDPTYRPALEGARRLGAA